MLENVPDYSALLGIVYDDGLTGVTDGLEDGGETTGVGGGEAGDGFEVVEEGEVVDDEDVGLGDDVGRQVAGRASFKCRQAAICRRTREPAAGRFVSPFATVSFPAAFHKSSVLG